jgi:cell wall assembly regulator SMI1
MDAVEVMERACAEHPELRLRPPPPRDELDALEAELGVRLPDDLRALLERAGGIDGGPLETIDFTGASFDVEIRDIFPSGVPIAHDGSGNHWVLDLTPDAAPPLVFFASHDPPVVLVQSPDVAHFLDEVFGDPLPSRKALVHEDRLFHAWRGNRDELDHAAALAGDEELRAFAATLDDRYTVVDLRTPTVGTGFSWGRHGPATEIRRGYGRLFAYAPPEPKPKSGLLGRLFR